MMEHCGPSRLCCSLCVTADDCLLGASGSSLMPAVRAVVHIRCDEHAGHLHRFGVHPTEFGTYFQSPATSPAQATCPAPKPELSSSARTLL